MLRKIYLPCSLSPREALCLIRMGTKPNVATTESANARYRGFFYRPKT